MNESQLKIYKERKKLASLHVKKFKDDFLKSKLNYEYYQDRTCATTLGGFLNVRWHQPNPDAPIQGVWSYYGKDDDDLDVFIVVSKSSVAGKYLHIKRIVYLRY